MIKKLVFFSIFLIGLTTITLQGYSQNPNRTIDSIARQDESFRLFCNDGYYHVEILNKYIIHTTFFPDSVPVKNQSYAAIMHPEDTKITLTDTKEKTTINTPGISITAEKSPARLSYQFNGKTLFAEKNGYEKNKNIQKITLSVEPEEIFYGGGERVLGMNRRGNRLEIYNQAHYGYTTHSELMNYALPLFLSSKKYTVLFDNASHAWLDLDSKNSNTISYEAKGGTINYYVVAAKDWYSLLEHYTQLTGRQPLPPRWVFGNFSSRFGYQSQEEVLQTIDRYFQDSIPVEAVILDLYWFGRDIKGHVGNLQWDRNAFPEPEKMIDSLKKRGVRTVLITEPFILTTSKRWNEAVEKDLLAKDSLGYPYTFDFYFGHTGLIDVFKISSRRWFWDIYKKLKNQGVEGCWGDLGEPEVHPADLQHVNGTAEEVHNAYGHEWAGIIYEGYQKDFPEERPFILMRAGFAGSQRYGLIPWTGDVSRSWGGLKPQPELSLQMGMQGIAYLHSDLGGFAGGDSLNTELYTRWLQYGVFQPIYRPHAQKQIPSEPVFMPQATKKLVREAIRLRYKLLPYVYDMAFDTYRHGKPMMIPLFFDNNEPQLMTYDSAYMWGEAFLVSPVTSPGVRKQTVYLPNGNKWIDFYTETSHEGGQYLTVDVAKEHIPVFVKGGSFVPMKAKAQNTQSYDLHRMEIHYYADETVKQSDYTLYNDDGRTARAFEKEMYELLHFEAKQQSKTLAVEANLTTGEKWKQDEVKNITFIIHALKQKPSKILVNGEKLHKNNWKWDSGKVVLKETLSGNRPVAIKLLF